MPIDMDLRSLPEDHLKHNGETNADRVMRFLATYPDQAFTQSEILDATDVNAGSISVVLSRLEDRGLVRHKGNYWRAWRGRQRRCLHEYCREHAGRERPLR